MTGREPMGLFKRRSNENAGTIKEPIAAREANGDAQRSAIPSGPDTSERLDRLEAAFAVLEQALNVKEREVELLRALIADCPRCSVLIKGTGKMPPPASPPPKPAKPPETPPQG